MSEQDYSQAAAQAYARLIEGVALALILLSMLVGSLFYLATQPKGKLRNQPNSKQEPGAEPRDKRK
jgi:hypothetical protein